MATINANVSAISVFKNLSRTSNSLSNVSERLASGLRINRPSDDPAGLGISELFRAEIKGSNTAIRNIDNAVNFFNTADGFLQNISDILGRLEELSVEFGDATKTDPDGTGDSGDLANINTEFRQLVSELDAIVGDGTTDAENPARARFNGKPIFTEEGKLFQIGPNPAQIFEIEDDTLDLANNSEFASFQDLLSFDTEFGVIEAGDPTDPEIGTIAAVQDAIDEVSNFRATLGSFQSQLQFTQSGLENSTENLQASESLIREADIAFETTQFARLQILEQVGIAVLAQANARRANVLNLLGSS